MATKLTANYKMDKDFKNFLGSFSNKEKRQVMKRAFVEADMSTQDKDFKGYFVMAYDVSANPDRNGSKPSGNKNKKERIRPEDNTRLKIN
jgi:hypothetical protein